MFNGVSITMMNASIHNTRTLLPTNCAFHINMLTIICQSHQQSFTKPKHKRLIREFCWENLDVLATSSRSNKAITELEILIILTIVILTLIREEQQNDTHSNNTTFTKTQITIQTVHNE